MKTRLEQGLYIVVSRISGKLDFVSIPQSLYNNLEGRALLREFLAPGDGLDHPVDPSLPKDMVQYHRVVLHGWKVPFQLPGFTKATQPTLDTPKYDHELTPAEAWSELKRLSQQRYDITAQMQK